MTNNICGAYRALSSFIMACLITTRTSENMVCQKTIISSLAIRSISRFAFGMNNLLNIVSTFGSFILCIESHFLCVYFHLTFQSPQDVCAPYSYDSQKKPIVPCGAIANSLFNGIISDLEINFMYACICIKL